MSDEETLQPLVQDKIIDQKKVVSPTQIPLSEIQIRLAHEYPRDLDRVLTKTLAELRFNPDSAEDMFYQIPYRKKANHTVNMVEGLSINGMMMLARNYGNNINANRVADDRGDKVICEGAFLDFETNVLTRREVEVSKWEYNRRLDPTRLRNATLAGLSKAVRNAMRHGIPLPLCDQVFDEAKRLFLGQKKGVTLEQRILDAKELWVKKLGATKEEIEHLISEWIADSDGKISQEDILVNLKGLTNAVREGSMTVADVFSRDEKKFNDMPKEKVNGDAKKD